MIFKGSGFYITDYKHKSSGDGEKTPPKSDSVKSPDTKKD